MLKFDEIVKMVDEICEEKGYEDSPAYALFEGVTSREEIEKILAALMRLE